MSSSRRGIVFFSAQDYWYHNRAHSDFQLTRGMARDRVVLLVNSIGMRMPKRGSTTQPWRRIVRKLNSIARAVRRPEPQLPNLVVMTPVILPFYGRSWTRALNAWVVRLQLRVVLGALRVSRPDVVVTIPTAWDVVCRMKTRSLTVNRSDKYSAFPETNQAVVADLERRLLGAADSVVYVSEHLKDEEAALVAGRAVFLGHGVDLEHFERRPAAEWPADIASLPRPIVGFFGGLDDYVVDFELIGRTADAMQEGSLVLIGDATCDMSALVAHERVVWLGPKPYAEIPAYGSAFDVAIMPWLDNEWIEHCNPIKTKEYLALGLPIVTTYYPEAPKLGDVMDIARSPEEFVQMVKAALRGDGWSTPELRRASVLGDSWQSRSDALVRLIESESR